MFLVCSRYKASQPYPFTMCEECISLAPDCTGYHHGPYCSIFGPNIDKTGIDDPDADDAVWFANVANETVITGTKANDQYICFFSIPMKDSSSGSSALTLPLTAYLLFIGASISSA